jgi:uncharacterized protein YggE
MHIGSFASLRFSNDAAFLGFVAPMRHLAGAQSMNRYLPLLAVFMLAAIQPAVAQPIASGPMVSGTRLDVVSTGEVTRVPDVVRIGAGVVTQARTATEAISQNARQMASVRSALQAAGIDGRDIQTSTINLNPDYHYVEGKSPVLTGYRATNEVSVRFRDIANTGKILDALVAQGANQINGPMFELDKPEEAQDEARLEALQVARQRAELYAGRLGKRVKRILSISETGAVLPYQGRMMLEAAATDMANTKIDPGEQAVSVNLTVSFELE